MLFETINPCPEFSASFTAFYTTAEIDGWKYDSPDRDRNFRMAADYFSLTPDRFVRTVQTHTSAVKSVSRENGGEGVTRDYGEDGYDGMATDCPSLMLCTLEADCVPVYLADPVSLSCAMVHSGWKGTAGEISANAVKLMGEKYGARAENIIAVTGPCICGECYEVGGELIESFRPRFTEDEIKSFFSPRENGKYLLDMKGAIRHSLLRSGLCDANIYDAGRCTYSDQSLCSYRRDRTDGRMLTGIMVNSECGMRNSELW